MRTVTDEVIRIIASNREWMKKYPIVKAIVMNPKTPLALSLNLFKRLMDLDLKILVRDKNVPEILRRGSGRRATWLPEATRASAAARRKGEPRVIASPPSAVARCPMSCHTIMSAKPDMESGSIPKLFV